MPFSVKSERADALLDELRALTGEGITEAVVHALEDRVRAKRQVSADTALVLHTLWAANPQLLWSEGDPEPSVTFNEWMYDDDGLPK